MTGFGLNFRPGRLRAAPALVDPATKNLTLYLAQRGDTSDYTTATGTWAGRPSAGPSGGRNLTQPTTGSRRTVSSPVDGKPLVHSEFADGRTFTNAPGTAASYMTGTAVAGVILLRVGTNSLNMAIAPFPQPWVLQDVNQFALMVSLGLDPLNAGKVAVGVGRYTGSWSSALRVGNLQSDKLVAMCFRHAAGKLQLSVDSAPSPANEVTCGNVANLSTALQILTASQFTGDVASLYLANALSDTDFTDIIAWEHAQFPTGYP